jgi:iron complex outermembrane receptor protein
MKTNPLLLSTAIVTVMVAPAAPGIAQAQAPVAGLEEIVVTAQRRNENLQQVPLSVTAIGADALARNDIRDLSRIDVLTPGFSFGRSGSDARPAIRGVRTENVAASGDPSIGFYMDNVYQSRASQGLVPFVDVGRVEVQRGPQGTLYGRNTFGGNIAVESHAPTDKFEGGISGIYGQYARGRADGFVNVPVSDSFAFRVAGLHEGMNGYVKGNDHAHAIYDRDTNYVRVGARLAPASSGFEAVLRYSYWSEKGTGGGAFGYRVGGVYVNPTTGAFDINGTPILINPKAKDGIPDVAGIDIGFPIAANAPLYYPGDVIIQQRVKQHQISANLSYDFGPVIAKSITGYTDFAAFRNADNDFSPRILSEDFQDDHLHTFSQELQLASSRENRLNWIVGAFYMRDNIFKADFYSFPETNLNGVAINARPKITSYAGFAQASYWVMPDIFKLTGGIRYTHDRKYVTRGNATVTNGVITASRLDINPATGQPYTPLDLKFSRTTWRANAEYYATQENLLYATVSTGFRSGGFNSGAFTNPNVPALFVPETVTAYEIGSKNRFLDDTLQVNLAAYYNKFKSLQVQNQFLIPAAGGGFTTSSAILNAASANSKGVEIEIQARPTRQLNLGLTATFSDAKFDNYKGAPAPALYTTIPGGYDLTNNRVPYNAHAKLTGVISYDFDLMGRGTLTPQVTALYSGGYFLTDFNKALDYQPGYAKIDLRLTYLSPDEKYSLEVFGDNVTNKVVLNRATFGSGGLNQNYDAPKMWGVRASAKF